MAEDFAIDGVSTALDKAGPEGLTKEELQAETGLSTNDLRDALAELDPPEREERIYSKAAFEDRFGSGAMVQPTDGRIEDEEEGDGDGEPAAAEAAGPPVPTAADGQMLARAQILVDVTYAIEEGKPPDVAAVESARTLLTDIPALWPALDVRPKLGTVEVFASKRVWPPTEE
jgi:hypothetical protein